jgi:glycosyltransferase involved in cell wall biosynthesis
VKRVDLLLRAFASSVERGSTLRLVIVGDGEDSVVVRDELRRLRLESRVELRGALPHGEAMAVLAGARALVLASASEACPLVVLEAMALGRAVIAPEVGGLRELVIERETGLLFPPDSLESLADRMLEVARRPDLADELGRRGAARAREVFDLDTVVDRYRELYRSTRPMNTQLVGSRSAG